MAVSFDQRSQLDGCDMEVLEQSNEKTFKPPTLAYQFQKAVLRLIYLFLPSWFQSIGKKPHVAKSATARTTAYLDGIRGLISILVFVRHFTLPWQSHLDYGYGHLGSYYDISRLPIIRLLFSGPLVPLFFVVSGYVLSAKSFRLCREKAWGDLYLSLASSTFRRPIRLFLPPLLSTFIVMLLAYGGGFSFDYDLMPGRKPDHPVALSNLALQIFEWSQFAFYELINPWTWNRREMLYGPHLYTIPVSFQGSLVVFLLCLGLTRIRPQIRKGVLLFLTISTLFYGRWYMAPFIGGVFLCELDLSSGKHILGNHTDNSRSPVSSWKTSVTHITGFLFGLYIGSFPRSNGHGQACVTGYQWLCELTADYHYWHGVSALLILLVLSRERILQRPLESAIVQYLGSISFSLYIVHEPFIHVVGFYSVPLFWRITGQEPSWRYQSGYLLGLVASGVALVWMADLFKSWVEDRCTRLAERIEKFCFVGTM